LTLSSGTQSIASRKTALRAQLRATRSALSTEQRAIASAAIGARLVALNLPRFCRAIAVYLAKPEEANIDAFIKSLIARGATVATPNTQSDAAAPFHTLRDLDEVRLGRFGVREPLEHSQSTSYQPSELDLIIAPGLAFDEAGGRLGFGGGWYDRALQSGVLPVGVCFDCQMIGEVPREPHDVAMAAIVTESRLIDIDGRLTARLGVMNHAV